MKHRPLIRCLLVVALLAATLAACRPEAVSSDTDSGPVSSPVTTAKTADRPTAATASSEATATQATTATPIFPPRATTPTEPAIWTVVGIVDGDTIDVRSTGRTERVRIIGIDTPERGECGFAEATSALSKRALQQSVMLPSGARDDRDRYGRILRYVDVGSTDAGLELIHAGLAHARYDSCDGYGRHDREDAYVTADAANRHICDPVPATPAVAPAAAPMVASSTPAAAPPVASPPATGGIPVQVFSKCTELNAVYPGGVARVGVMGNIASGQLRAFGKQPVFDDALYAANAGRDGDKDGIACEK